MKPIFSDKGVESARELNSEAKVVKKNAKEPEKKHSVYVPELRATIYTNNPDVSGVRNRYIKLYQMPESVQDESEPEAEESLPEAEDSLPEPIFEAGTKPEPQPQPNKNKLIRFCNFKNNDDE